jgi:hypothetical protein
MHGWVGGLMDGWVDRLEGLMYAMNGWMDAMEE